MSVQSSLNETLTTLRTQGEQLGAQAREFADALQSRGKAIVAEMRKTVDTEYTKLRKQAAELQSKAQSLIQEHGAEPAKAFIVAETELFERVQDLLGKARSEVSARADFLTPAFHVAEQALSAVRTLDARAQTLLDKVFAGRQLPIADYNNLNVTEVTKALKKLTRAELKVIEAYETRNKARKTILSEIAQLLAN